MQSEAIRLQWGAFVALQSLGKEGSLEEAPEGAFTALAKLKREHTQLRIAVRRLSENNGQSIIIATDNAEHDYLVGAWGKGGSMVDLINLPTLFRMARKERRAMLRREIENRLSNAFIIVMMLSLFGFIFLMSKKDFSAQAVKILTLGGAWSPLLFVFGFGGGMILLFRLVSWAWLPRRWRADTVGQKIDMLTRRYPVAL